MSRLADINVGDKVILPDGPFSPGRVAIVEKTTKTQFTAGGDRTLAQLSQACKLYLSPIQEIVAAAVRAKDRDDQLSLIDHLEKTVAILKTIPPFVKQ